MSNTTTDATTLGAFDDRGAACATANNHNRAIMLAMLKRMGIARVRIEFDGGGDSGQVQGIECQGLIENPGEHFIDDVLLATVNTRFCGARNWDYEVQLEKIQVSTAQRRGNLDKPTLRDAIEAWAYEMLDGVEYDWVNNDGGYGEITIQPTPPEGEGEIAIEMNIRVTTIEAHYLSA
jgi:hypothetical protein